MGKRKGDRGRDTRDEGLDQWVQAESDNYLDPVTEAQKSMSRRQVLGLLGAGGAALGVGGYVISRETIFDPVRHKKRHRRTHGDRQGGGSATPETQPPTTEPPPPPALWSDPATWGGELPGPDDIAVIDRPVILDIDTQVGGVQIEPTGQLIYDPAVTHTLGTSGNVVVHGRLQMRPANATIQHLLSFVGVNEGGFTGGHTEEPIDGDVGVWVQHGGVLDLFGASKTAWTNLSAEAGPGATTIIVNDANGWQLGDEIVVTPTEPAHKDEDHWTHHDRRVITAVTGNQVSLDRPLDFPHPFVTVRDGVTHAPEVLNLSRNVRIEGAPDARAHVILLHAMAAQSIGWVGLRHMGPQGVLGRYGLHFHMCEDGVRGSTVEGVVGTDLGNHAFVTHLSNGVSLTDCVAHDVIDDAFWWDLVQGDQDRDEIPSNDILYDRCVASYVHIGLNEHTTTGFLMGAGSGNVARNCRASGVDGHSKGTCGFRWSSHSRDTNTWTFEDNVAHNNRFSGIYYWQNHAARTIVDRFTAYHNSNGIFAGAYRNLVSYRDNVIYACKNSGLTIHATTGGDQASPTNIITYEGMYIDQVGLSDYAVEITEHILDGDLTTRISDGVFKGGNAAQIGWATGGDNRQMYEIVNCSFEGNAFFLDPGIPDGSVIHVVDGAHGSIMLHPEGGPGQRNNDWNATFTSA
jgi:hypothetical protein